MGKKIKKSKDLMLLVLFLILTASIYAQEYYTKEIKWNNGDSIKMPFFKDTNQIIEWGKSRGKFANVQSDKITIKNNEIFILRVDICSGIYCLDLYVFELRKKDWRLVTSSFVKLTKPLKVEVDNERGKILFKTEFGQIGELSSKMFELYSENLNNKL